MSAKIIKFYGTYCSLCKIFDRTYKTIKDEYKDKVEFEEYEQAESPEVFAKYSVLALPTIIYLKNGEEVIRHVRAEPYDVVKNFIDKNLVVVEEEEVKAK